MARLWSRTFFALTDKQAAAVREVLHLAKQENSLAMASMI